MSRSLRSRDNPNAAREVQSPIEERLSIGSNAASSSASHQEIMNETIKQMELQLRSQEETIKKLEKEKFHLLVSTARQPAQQVERPTLPQETSSTNTENWVHRHADPLTSLVASFTEALHALQKGGSPNQLSASIQEQYSRPKSHNTPLPQVEMLNTAPVPPSSEAPQVTQTFLPQSYPTQAQPNTTPSYIPHAHNASAGREYEDYARMNALMARQSSAKDLPTFDGSPYEWPTFKGQFDQSTAMCNLSSAENLIRLQRALKGRARDRVISLLVDPRNVSNIMKTLETHFGHPEILVSAMLGKLRDMSRLPEDASTEALMDYATTVRNIVATVDGVGPDYLATPQVLSKMIAKLPTCVRVLWFNDKRGVEKCTIYDFAEWIDGLFSSARYLGGVEQEEIAYKSTKSRRVNVLFQSDAPGKSSSSVKCSKCNGSHKLKVCPDYLELDTVDRWNFVKSIRVCFVCLETGHSCRNCRQKNCGVSGCRKFHHRSLHSSRENVESVLNISRENVEGISNISRESAESILNSSRESTESVLNISRKNTESDIDSAWNGYPIRLKVVPVKISGPQGSLNVYALLDEGSTVTLLDAEVAGKIGACGPINALEIHGANGMCSTERTSRRVKIEVRGDSEKYAINANTVNNFDLPWQYVNRVKTVKPRLLVGQDNAHIIVAREVKENGNGVYKSRSALGWTTHGGINPINENTTLAIRGETNHNEDRDLYELVKMSFAVDALGVTSAVHISPQDKRALMVLRNTTRPINNGQWETGLLWKDENSQLPENRNHAMRRLLSLERKLKREPKLADAYRIKMQHYLDMGYARQLTEIESRQVEPRRWYLPHFAVTNPHKPTKLRIVFDAASRYRGTSLNDVLLTGPDLLKSLFGNIVRFREGKIAIAADIREMFLQIKIKKVDQQAQLFLWRERPEDEPQAYIMQSMMFGAKCSPSSAQYVRDEIAKAHEGEFPRAAAAIRSQFYMDDYLDAVNSPWEAKEMIETVSEVLRRGGFDLRNWASNDPQVLNSALENKHERGTKNILNRATYERVLGVVWDTKSDAFVFNFNSENKYDTRDTRWTKRKLLSEIMRYFDPLGLVACLTVRTKILLQAVWRSKVGWDDPIEPEHEMKWIEWHEMVTSGHYIIPRCTVRNKENTIVLHVFSDASESACCTVAYLVEYTTENVYVTFAAAKCKVAPLRPLSVPRLELQAALMAARLAANIKKESKINIKRTVYWTDSTTVLCWLRSDPRIYSSYVACRLGEIDELTSVPDWKWVPTKENPADIGTRDNTPPDMEMWFNGPPYLKKPKEEWPVEKKGKVRPEASYLEMKTKMVLQISKVEDAFPDIRRFSSWDRLIRTTAWTMRFISRCRRKVNRTRKPYLTAEELQDAEIRWCLKSQRDSFSAEIKLIRNNERLKKGNRLISLTPFYSKEGVLRMGTRILRATNTPIEVKSPIILDGTNDYTRLLIRHYHEKAGHPGTERIVSDLRERYYITQLRSNLRKISFNCQTCRVQKSQPKPPLMGQLPTARLAVRLRPFTHCGLDFFGPMMVTIGRRKEKRYGALFTCMTTRAVHIELANSLTSDSAIMALRRMTARRGYPTVIYSDNGTNFHGANREIINATKALQDNERVQSEMSNNRIKWLFNPPSSPHMGGAWERLVRSVKRALETSLRERAPREETLLTALAEAEYSVNSRPLTHVSVDPLDAEPLTPNHFLLGSASGRPHLALYNRNEEEVCLRKQWQIAQQLADMFWRRWVREYLPTIAQRRKWQESASNIKEGDIVVITDGSLPRNSWPRGRVISATPAIDGQVRTVRIQTATGVYVRPAVKVAVIPTTQEL